MTYKLHSDIKSWLIPTSALSLPYYDYILVSHLSHLHYFYILVFSSLQHAFLVNYGPQAGAWRSTKKIISRSTPIQILVVVAWEEYFRPLLMKAIGGSHSKWWAIRLVERSISPTLENVNISFNHLPYYSMSRGDGRVVTNKRWAW